MLYPFTFPECFSFSALYLAILTALTMKTLQHTGLLLASAHREGGPASGAVSASVQFANRTRVERTDRPCFKRWHEQNTVIDN